VRSLQRIIYIFNSDGTGIRTNNTFGCPETKIEFRFLETLDEAHDVPWQWNDSNFDPDTFTWKFKENSIEFIFSEWEFTLPIEVNNDNIIQINDERIPLIFFKDE